MRTAVTLTRKRGATAWELHAGPDVPVFKQLESFKRFCMSPVNGELAEVSFREDGAESRNHTFITPEKAKAKAELKAVAATETKPVEKPVQPHKYKNS